MRIRTFLIPAALITSIGSVTTANADAVDCNQLAPTLKMDNQDDYFDFTFEPIDTAQRGQLLDFAYRLSGNWSGTQTESVCVGHFKSPRNQDTRYQVTAEITEQFNGSIRLAAEKESRRKVALEKVFLSPTINSGSGDTAQWQSGAVTFAGNDSIVFSDKYHARNGRLTPATLRNTVRTVEELKKITLNESTLKIDRQTYVNGHLVSQDAWDLVRQ